MIEFWDSLRGLSLSKEAVAPQISGRKLGESKDVEENARAWCGIPYVTQPAQAQFSMLTLGQRRSLRLSQMRLERKELSARRHDGKHL